MRTLLSTRRAKFFRMIVEANSHSTEWLTVALQDKTRNRGYASALARLACLRVLVLRNITGAGLCYAEKKRFVRAELGSV
jgi:hypothetical protein